MTRSLFLDSLSTTQVTLPRHHAELQPKGASRRLQSGWSAGQRSRDGSHIPLA
jgi:hypothetical protein